MLDKFDLLLVYVGLGQLLVGVLIGYLIGRRRCTNKAVSDRVNEGNEEAPIWETGDSQDG